MRRIPGSELASPIGELNTTPLIDVLLVLIVMFVISFLARDPVHRVEEVRESGQRQLLVGI